MENNIWPQKVKEMHNHHFDSTVWNDYKFRDDDIIMASYAKSGSTWVQQIVSQLIFNGAADLPVAEMSPWLDLRIPPNPVKLQVVEEQKHRRFIKTHLPVEALVYSNKAKYIYIARDGRDVVWSMYNHHASANETWYEAINNTPGREGPPIDKPVDSVEQYFKEWLEKDGFPFWPMWENVTSWWNIRHLPNLLMIHFENLKKDMAGEIRKIAGFLNITVDESKWDDILEHCSFNYMKENGVNSVPLGGMFWDGGAKTFIHKGKNGRWREMLSDQEVQQYETTAIQKLGNDCARWLATGQLNEKMSLKV